MNKIKEYIDFKIDKKLAIYFIISFMLFTVIGTLTHEMGHITVAKYFGYETELHYGSMNYFHKGEKNDIDAIRHFEILKENFEAIKNDEYFKGKEEYLLLDKLLDKKYPPYKNDHYIIWGGPIQTILTSFLGLFILYYRKSKKKVSFQILDWIGIFLSLFILREVFNFVMAMFSFFVHSNFNFHGDEFRLSRYYGCNEWVIPFFTVLLGIWISLYIIFKVIPKKHRFTFILSGLIGGILGFLIWFGVIGKYFLP